MKMMDVWLAMNSDPKKDKFRPEIQFAYQMAQGDYDLRVGKNNVVDDFMKSDYLSNVGRLQLYLTNIVTAATGWKMPNIDLGMEFLAVMDSISNNEFQIAPTPTETVQKPLHIFWLCKL